jgi:hypothetical protein
MGFGPDDAPDGSYEGNYGGALSEDAALSDVMAQIALAQQKTRDRMSARRDKARQLEDVVLNQNVQVPEYARNLVNFTPARSKIANANNYPGMVNPESDWHGVNAQNFTPGSDDNNNEMWGGADPYNRVQQRIPDYGAYVDLYKDLIAAQPAGMSKSNWGKQHWERHGGQEGRNFYGPSQINHPVGPDGTTSISFIDYAQPPAFNGSKRPELAYENAYNQWQGGDQPF